MHDRRDGHVRKAIAALLLSLFLTLSGIIPPGLADEKNSLKAFYVTELPRDYAVTEKLFATLRESGADTVMAGPLAVTGPLTKNTLPHIVFLAHQAKLKLYIIMPMRTDPEALASHPGWEDTKYDLQSGALQPSGTLDLFNADVERYLSGVYRNVASFSVDGILFGNDTLYEDIEGMSRTASDAYRQRYKSDFDPGKAFARVDKADDFYRVVEYGEGYQNYTQLKQARLAELVKKIISVSREVNKDVRFAVPLRFAGYENQIGSLPEYSRTVTAFGTADPDYYWVVLPHREQAGLNYRKGMEAAARTAKIVTTSVKIPSRVILVLPMTNPSGRLLAYTEIEEITEMVKKGGNLNIAYRLKNSTEVPLPLMRKLFKGQQ